MCHLQADSLTVLKQKSKNPKATVFTFEFLLFTLFFSPAEFVYIHSEVQAALVKHLLYFRQ